MEEILDKNSGDGLFSFFFHSLYSKKAKLFKFLANLKLVENNTKNLALKTKKKKKLVEMAPKQQIKTKVVTAQVKSSITTRRGKLKEAEEVKKSTSIKSLSVIKKFKLNTEKKPKNDKKGGDNEEVEKVEAGGGERKVKKIHKCSICGKVFKGVP